MKKHSLFTALLLSLFMQCNTPEHPEGKQTPSVASATAAGHAATEMHFARYRFTGVPGQEKDFSQTRWGQQPYEVWGQHQAQNSTLFLYRFDSFDVLAQQGEESFVKLYRPLPASNTHPDSLRVQVPAQALLQVPGTTDAQGFYYLTGLTDDYLFVDEGTSACRRYNIYSTKSLQQIYSFTSCDKVELTAPDQLTFMQETDIAPEQLRCYAHLRPEERQSYRYVVVEQVTLNLQNKHLTKSGKLSCAYRE